MLEGIVQCSVFSAVGLVQSSCVPGIQSKSSMGS